MQLQRLIVALVMGLAGTLLVLAPTDTHWGKEPGGNGIVVLADAPGPPDPPADGDDTHW